MITHNTKITYDLENKTMYELTAACDVVTMQYAVISRKTCVMHTLKQCNYIHMDIKRLSFNNDTNYMLWGWSYPLQTRIPRNNCK